MEATTGDSVIGRRLARRAVTVVENTARPDSPAGTINLAQPALPDPPAAVRSAANEALDRGETHYTSPNGIPQLLGALATRSTAEGFPAEPDAVVVTNGGSEALYIALQAVVKPGQRVLVAGPVAPVVPTIIGFVGGETVQLVTTAATRFNPTAEAIAEIDADILLLASPSPVTGVAIPPVEVAEIARAGIERGMAVILDRTLAWCCYDPALATFADPEVANQLLTVGSLSLAYEMPGWRTGYLTTPAEHAQAVMGLKLGMSICTSPITQFAALAALNSSDDWLGERRSTMLARRDAVINRLADISIPTVTPDAWPYLLLDTRLIHPDDRLAAAMLREQAGVYVEPASPYSSSLSGYTRITLAAEPSSLSEGLDRLISFHNTCI